MTQEFNLSVTPVGNSQYLIRTEQVPYGAPLGQEQIVWPVEQWLGEAQQLIGDPLKGLLQAGAMPDAERSAISLIELGQKLYASLFRGTLRDSWLSSQVVAQHRRDILRLRLGLKGADLLRLPWEVMYGLDVPVEQLLQGSINAAPRPMAAGTRITFSRYQINSRLVEDNFPELLPHQPIRILMVVSAPTDQAQLKLYREVKQMQQELQAATSSSLVSSPAAAAEMQLTILNQPGREELARALEQGRFQVLHYAGHSDLSAAGGSLYLVNNRTGLSEIMTGDDLAGLLVNTGIRLAVFNSCRGAHTAADASGSNRTLAEALVSRGIPAVLAMAEQIPDDVALNLTRWFYHNLKQGSPIDLSLNRARQGLIATYGSQQFYWALPVLYLHPKFNGQLLAHEPTATGSDYLLSPPRYAAAKPAEPPALPAEPPRIPQPLPNLGASSHPANSLTEGAAPDDISAASPVAITQILEQLSPPSDPNRAASPASQVAEPPAAEPPEALGNSSQAALKPQDSRADSTAVRQRSIGRFWLLPILGAVGAVAYIGLYGIPNGASSWPILGWLEQRLSPQSPSPEPLVDPTASTEELRAKAENIFQQGESVKQGQGIEPGVEAVKLILERGALEQASVALSAAPAEIKDDARLNFLRGRLAWQGMKAADSTHTLEQARSFWEIAVEADPNNLDYQQALMFAYYRGADPKDLEKAIQTWSTANANPDLTDDQILDFTAMAALVLQKRADGRSAPERDDHLQNAVLLYQKVISRDPKRFTPEALAQNWLWTADAIKDWQRLAEVKSDSNPASPAVSSPPVSPTASPSVSPSVSPSPN